MRDRTARLVAASALAVGLLGWTGAGEAVRNAVLPPGSVGETQLRDNAVTAKKIRSGSVTSADVKNGSLRASDLYPGTIPTFQLVVRRATRDLTGVGQFDLSISCDPGQTVLGGGGGFLSATGAQYTGNEFYGSLVNSGPVTGDAATDDRGAPSGWRLTARNAGGKKRLVTYAICLTRPPPTQGQAQPPSTTQPPASP